MSLLRQFSYCICFLCFLLYYTLLTDCLGILRLLLHLILVAVLLLVIGWLQLLIYPVKELIFEGDLPLYTALIRCRHEYELAILTTTANMAIVRVNRDAFLATVNPSTTPWFISTLAIVTATILLWGLRWLSLLFILLVLFILVSLSLLLLIVLVIFLFITGFFLDLPSVVHLVQHLLQLVVSLHARLFLGRWLFLVVFLVKLSVAFLAIIILLRTRQISWPLTRRLLRIVRFTAISMVTIIPSLRLIRLLRLVRLRIVHRWRLLRWRQR